MILIVWKFYHAIRLDFSFPMLNVKSKDKPNKKRALFAQCLF